MHAASYPNVHSCATHPYLTCKCCHATTVHAMRGQPCVPPHPQSRSNWLRGSLQHIDAGAVMQPTCAMHKQPYVLLYPQSRSQQLRNSHQHPMQRPSCNAWAAVRAAPSTVTQPAAARLIPAYNAGAVARPSCVCSAILSVTGPAGRQAQRSPPTSVRPRNVAATQPPINRPCMRGGLTLPGLQRRTPSRC